MAFVTIDLNSKMTWSKCLRGSDAEEWLAKGLEEKENFEKHGAIEKIRKEDLVELSKDKQCKVQVIPSFALPQEKYDPVTGKTIKKVRIVADGSKQRFLDIPNTYSPTPPASSFRLTVSVSAEKRQPLYHADFGRAFLHSPKVNDKVIHILRPPPGVEEDGVYWMAKHVVYGLREAPRAFHNTIKPVLQNYGLRQVPGDQCLWTGTFDGIDVYVLVQVDDLLVSSPGTWYQGFLAYLRSHGFLVKDLGLASRFMNVSIEQRLDQGMIIITQ